MSEANWKESIESDVDKALQNKVFTPEFRRKRLIAYVIRTILTIVIYVVFWETEWVAWTLVVVVPMNLFSLIMIFAGPIMLRQKAEKIKETLNEVEESPEAR